MCVDVDLAACSPHRQNLTAHTGKAHPEACNGGVSWTWSMYQGGSVVGGCTANASSCVLKSGSATGQPGNRYVVACINGGSGFGAWVSCDYYAVEGASCKENPTLHAQVSYSGGITTVPFGGSGWDTAGCRTVSLSAVGEQLRPNSPSAVGGHPEAVPVAYSTKPTFEGSLHINGHLCGLELIADQPIGYEKTVMVVQKGKPRERDRSARLPRDASQRRCVETRGFSVFLKDANKRRRRLRTRVRRSRKRFPNTGGGGAQDRARSASARVRFRGSR